MRGQDTAVRIRELRDTGLTLKQIAAEIGCSFQLVSYHLCAPGSRDSTQLCACGCGRTTPLAKSTRRALGHVRGEPLRFVNGHNATVLDPESYFWSRVDKDGPVSEFAPDLGPCWLWTGSLATHGYGMFRARGHSNGAHAWIYERVNGPIPEGMEIDHLCRVRACVRPDHLEAVPPSVNARRSPVRTKLSYEQVAEIAASRKAGVPLRDVMRRFGISETHAAAIRSGWRPVGFHEWEATA